VLRTGCSAIRHLRVVRGIAAPRATSMVPAMPPNPGGVFAPVGAHSACSLALFCAALYFAFRGIRRLSRQLFLSEPCACRDEGNRDPIAPRPSLRPGSAFLTLRHRSLTLVNSLPAAKHADLPAHCAKLHRKPDFVNRRNFVAQENVSTT
jgi:hypothetical protein